MFLMGAFSAICIVAWCHAGFTGVTAWVYINTINHRNGDLGYDMPGTSSAGFVAMSLKLSAAPSISGHPMFYDRAPTVYRIVYGNNCKITV